MHLIKYTSGNQSSALTVVLSGMFGLYQWRFKYVC